MSPEREAFRDYVRGLSAYESPMLIALRELVVLADARGRLSRERLVEAFREAYVRRYSEAAVEGSAEARRLVDIQRMSREEVKTYLEEQVLTRLLAEGWLERSDGAEQPEVVCFAPRIWAGIAASRSGATDLIDREIDRRLRPEREADGGGALADGSELRARSLVKVYKKRRVVDDVDLEVRQGEIVGLLGPNGAGKTTTFYMIVGLIPPNAGQVFLDDEDLTHVAMYKRARKGIGYLSQEPSVFRKLTVQQNILAILETLSLSEEEKQARLESLLDELSIKHLRNNKAYSLSGGERRRLEITRALVTDPKFMLLDEPFAGVDPIAVDDIQRIVAGLKERGLGVLITDHNVRETLSITDRAYIMFDGRIHMEGTSEELVSDPQARKLYLGEDFRL